MVLLFVSGDFYLGREEKLGILTCIELGICKELHELRAILRPNMVACAHQSPSRRVYGFSCTLQMSGDFAKCSGITIDIKGSYIGSILGLKQLILEEL